MIRTCVSCGNKAEKNYLLRFSVVNGQLCADYDYSLAGRGAYCCKIENCIMTLLNRKEKQLAKALRCGSLQWHRDKESFVTALMTSIDLK